MSDFGKISLALSCFLLFSLAALGQVVSGQVSDKATGEPLPGVGVTVRGTTRGVVTNLDGRYSVEAAPGTELEYSCLGFKTVRETLDGRKVIDVALEADVTQLDEVVLLGYSSMKRTELSSSVVSVQGESLRDVSTSSLSKMLQGKVAGLEVYSNSGAPGAGATIRIRGTGSITASSDPLYIVDGVAGDASSFSPNDIASITVLKDAGATALYGASGAGGVIVITTRQPQNGQRTQVEVSAKAGVKQALSGRLKMMNTEELLDYYSQFLSKGALKALTNNASGTDYDWYGNNTVLAPTQNYYVSATGSQGRMSYLASFDYFDEKGTFKGGDSFYRKLSGRLGLNTEIARNLSLDTRLSYSLGTGSSGGVIGLSQLPFDSPIDENTGDWVCIRGSERPDNGKTWYGHDKNNPLYQDTYGQSNRSHNHALVADAKLSWNITDHLSASGSLRYSFGFSDYKDVITPEAGNANYPAGRLTQTADWGSSLSLNALLKYSRTFGDAHNVAALAGWEWGKSRSQYITAQGRDMTGGLTQLNVSVPDAVGGNLFEGESWSWFAQAQYSFRERYILSATLRSDSSSVFAPGKRTGYFPAVSAAWVVSGEPFLQDQHFLSFLKLRASYGATGNSALGYYKYLEVYSFPENSRYENQVGGLPQNQGNPNLHWETAIMRNLGLDVTFADRVSVSLDLYSNLNKDLLLAVPLSRSTGFDQRVENSGTIRNRGVELQITSQNVKLRNFKWTTSFNIARNRNTVVYLPGHQDIIMSTSLGTQIYRENEPLFSWYMPKWLGVDPENGNPQWEHFITEAELELGVYDPAKYKAGDTAPTPNLDVTRDSQIIGCAQPDFTGGLSNTFTAWGFTLDVNMQFIYGNDIFNFARRTIDCDGSYSDFNQMSLDNGLGWVRWKEDDESTHAVATHPKPKNGGNKNANEPTGRYLEDGSYFRIKNVTLSYAIPAGLLKRVGLSAASVFVSADNLWTYSRFSGMDPEVNLTCGLGDTYPAGTYNNNYPVSRVFLAGVNLKF